MPTAPDRGDMVSEPPPEARLPLLERLGLHRRELRSWAMYEWAITGMYAVIVTAIFPVYYETVASQGVPTATAQARFGTATTIGIVSVAVVAPIIGAVTDQRRLKKPLLTAFMLVGVTGAAGLYFVQQGDWLLALTMFVLINVGVNGSTVFYDALLPHIAAPHEVDRVSTGAFAVGYLGAGLLLAASLVLLEVPELFGLGDADATLPPRLSFLAVAAWWLAFSLPLIRGVREPVPRADPDEIIDVGPLLLSLRRLRRTFASLRQYRHAFALLIAFFVYGDGIGSVIRLSVVYGSGLGIGQGTLIGAIVMVQFVGVPFAFAFGWLAGRIGTKRSLLGGLSVYIGVVIFAFWMTSALQFWILAFFVAMVQGGTQALSRSLYASMIPAHKSGEFFGFFGVMDKFAGMMGPGVFAFFVGLTGSGRYGILSILLFFVVGIALLLTVDEREGRRVAAEETAEATRRSDVAASSES